MYTEHNEANNGLCIQAKNIHWTAWMVEAPETNQTDCFVAFELWDFVDYNPFNYFCQRLIPR